MGINELVQAYFLISVIRVVGVLAIVIVLSVFYLIFSSIADRYVNYKRSKRKKGVDIK